VPPRALGRATALALVLVGCSTIASGEGAADECRAVADLALEVALPGDLRPATTVDLPSTSGLDDPALALVDVAGLGPTVVRVGVFRFADPRTGPLVPPGGTVEEVEATTGPEGIRGVLSRRDGVLHAAVMARGVEPAALRSLLEAGSGGPSDDVSFGAAAVATPVAALDPSDVPGVGSLALAAGRTGRLRSFTDDATRRPEADQRAVVVGSSCASPGDRGRLDVLSWWYGVDARPVAGTGTGGGWRQHAFAYGAPAGNGAAELHLWERGRANLSVATFGLTPTEAAAVFAAIDEEVGRRPAGSSR
jgi:hypothetical protein